MRMRSWWSFCIIIRIMAFKAFFVLDHTFMLVGMEFDGRPVKTKIIPIGATKNCKKHHKKENHFYKIFHPSSFSILPSLKGKNASARLIISWSCVAIIIVHPCSRPMLNMSWTRSLPVSVSKLAVGSSAKSI